MLPKNNRANRKDLDKVFKKGSFLVSQSLTFRYIKSKTNKISFITPKTVSKSAVVRNSLRRQGYLALKRSIKNIPFPVVGAFLFKKKNTENLENEIKTIFNKVN